MASPTHRVFVDSSVLMAATISARGRARDLLDASFRGEMTLILSDDVIGECRRNLGRKAPHVLPLFEEFLTTIPDRAEPTAEAVREIAQVIEPKDAPIVAAAVAAQATHLASYDRRHLLTKAGEIGARYGIVVVTPDVLIAPTHLDDR